MQPHPDVGCEAVKSLESVTVVGERTASMRPGCGSGPVVHRGTGHLDLWPTCPDCGSGLSPVATGAPGVWASASVLICNPCARHYVVRVTLERAPALDASERRIVSQENRLARMHARRKVKT